MKSAIWLLAALLLQAPGQARSAPGSGQGAPGSGQSVRSGIDAWHKGDHAAAVAIWTPLAARGDADAAFNLGQAYRLGKGVAIDLGRAHRNLEQAALKEHVDAAATLGILMFQNGNRPGAMRWLKLAADAGEPRAMLLYGAALYNGDGVPGDPVSAYAYVSRATAQGQANASETLADMDAAMPLAQRTRGVALAKSMVAARQRIAPAARTAAPVTLATAAPPRKAAARISDAEQAPLPNLVVTTPGDSDTWRIQLGAFSRRATAEALFAIIRDRVGSRQPYYVPAGKVIRLQLGQYRTRADAAAACARLSGIACFPVAVR